ncbi:hypothetical protein [Nocardia arizonensis]
MADDLDLGAQVGQPPRQVLVHHRIADQHEPPVEQGGLHRQGQTESA